MLSFIRAFDREETLTLDITIERLEGYREGLGAASTKTSFGSAVRTPQDPHEERRQGSYTNPNDPPPSSRWATSWRSARSRRPSNSTSGPTELSLVGFDDGPAAALATPPLTTVAQPHEEKGRIATEQLLDAIKQRAEPPEPPARIILPTLIVRDSAAPPRPTSPSGGGRILVLALSIWRSRSPPFLVRSVTELQRQLPHVPALRRCLVGKPRRDPAGVNST